MASRDRFGGFAEPATTPLQRYIQNACDPQNFEPNLALDLEVADLINAKKGNAPREAAVSIVTHANHRNPNVSLLALTLLDICAKNCGYPFHLQISTKEFLNELVRRFPEKPPIRYSRVQNKILELIEEWRQTICQNSKYRDDLGYIRDMHRLLSFKGYMFPEVKREDAAVLNPSEALRSAEEMEEEERAAQSAKLQELIRRGGIHDLKEANKLMKVMAGYDNRHKTDYRAKAAEEVGKIQQKARILEEMLQEYKPGDQNINGDSFEDLANALASAQPKIQKMCEEESEDTEAVAKLFEINDSIHRTLQRYRLTKKGDLEGASKIPKGTLGTSGAGVSKGPDNELSLIDFGPGDLMENQSPSEATATGRAGSSARPEDDLLGLSLQDDIDGVGGAISLGPDSNARQTLTPSSVAPTLALPPTVTSQPVKPNYNPFSTLSLGQQSTHFTASTSPAAITPRQPQTAQYMTDPFAALSTTGSGRSSPFQYQQATQNPASSLNPLADINYPSQLPSALKAPSSPSAQKIGSAPEEEWTFSSALPDQPPEVVVTNSSVRIVFNVSRLPGPEAVISINSAVSNNTPNPISDLTFQIAVMKGYSLKLQPQSGRNLQPNQMSGITQIIQLHGVEPGKGQSVKVRWKASYWLGEEHREEQGEISSLGVS